MKELGSYTPVTPITNREAIEMAIDETYIPFGEKSTVLEWFGKILGEDLTEAKNEPIPDTQITNHKPQITNLKPLSSSPSPTTPTPPTHS